MNRNTTVFLLIIALSLCVTNATEAAVVDSTRALRVASNYAYSAFAHSKSVSPEYVKARIDHVILNKEGSKPLLYFINIEPDGFLIVSGDDRCFPIPAFSDIGNLSKEEIENPPPGVRWFLEGYAEQVRQASESERKATQEVSDLWLKYDNSKGGIIAKGQAGELERLGNIAWGQTHPFNALCPETIDEHPSSPSRYKGRTPAGCVAVAMAQIMKYWEWPAYGNGVVSYTDPPNEVVDTFRFDPSYGPQYANLGATAYAWHEMKDFVYEPNIEMATIIRQAGVAALMDYVYYASGTSISSALSAFKENFRFSHTATTKSKGLFESWESWEDKIIAEIDAGRPVYYRGENSKSGHAFICYGYKVIEGAPPLFKFNWGWGAEGNIAYGGVDFTVRDLVMDSNINYPNHHKIITNLIPDGSAMEPCNSPTYHIYGLGPSHSKSYVGGGLGAWFTNENNSCGVKSPGVEKIYSFVAPVTGTYSLEVTSAESGSVSFMWKDGLCSATGWKAIGNVSSPGSYGNMEWIAGTAYHILIDDHDAVPGLFTFHIKEPVLPPVTELNNGSVNPNSGTDTDSYSFSVIFKSTGGVAPVTNSVKVVGYGWEHVLIASGSNWSDGVQFTKNVSGFSPGNYSFWFICSSNGVSYRFPESGSLNFTVSQNAVGWDARVNALSANRSYFSGSTNIIAYGTITNYSVSGNTYNNLPLKFEMLNPSGNVIHQSTYTISQLTPGASYDVQTPSISIASSDPNGVYQVRLTIFPHRDSNSSNNSRSINVIKGTSANAEHFHIKSADYMKEVSAGQTYVFGGYNLQFSTITSNRVSIRDQYNKIYTLYLNDFVEIDQGNYVVLFAANFSSSLGIYHFGAKDPSKISYENTSVSGFPGQKVEFIAHTNSPNTLMLASGFNYDPGNVKSWYNSNQSVLFNSNRSIKRYFTIPSSATAGKRVFYFLTGIIRNNEYMMSRLEINVLQPVPVITSLSSSRLTPGSTVTITGATFGTTKGEVKFNDLPATISSWSNTSIKCVVPAEAISGLLTVKNSGGISNGATYEVYYSIAASASPSNGGSVSGGGNYDYGSSVNLIATPTAGWSFAGWKENGSVVSVNESYTFTAASNRSIEAIFTQDSYDISLICSPAAGGVVSGSGSYRYGDVVSISALPNVGYRFLNWSEYGVPAYSNASQVFTASGDRTLIANFSELPLYSLIVNTEGNGSVWINDSIYNGPRSFYHGTTIRIDAIPDEGWFFYNWSGDIASDNPAESIVIAQSASILARFTITNSNAEEQLSDVIVYPNPFADKISLGNANSVRRITLTTITGVKVLDIYPTQSPEITLPVERLKGGLYFLTIYDNANRIQTWRIIKQ